MTTYIYESIPEKKGEKVEHYEIRQSMKDSALTVHPETGKKIRRVVTGGYGLLRAGGSPAAAPAPQGHCCGGNGCCR
jgi:predicted nucleic acid-binding Zn ribbon protein